MSPATWVAIYLPLFVLFFVILPAQHKAAAVRARKKRKGEKRMANELFKKYIGKDCLVSSGSFGQTIQGVLSAVEDNWIEMQTNRGSRLVNVDYVTHISEITAKKGK